MIHPRKNFCTKCSLQFGNNHVYNLHLELLHKNEIKKTMIKKKPEVKSEDLVINTGFLVEPYWDHQISSIKGQNEKLQKNEKNIFQKGNALMILSKEQVKKESFENGYTAKEKVEYLEQTKYASIIFPFTLKLVKLSQEEINKWTQIKSFSIILPKLQGKLINFGIQKKQKKSDSKKSTSLNQLERSKER